MLRFPFDKLLVVMLLTIGMGLQAQEVHINSHKEAFELALEQNLDLQNLMLNEQYSELEHKQNKSYRLPTISGTFSNQRNLDLATTPLPAEIFGGEPGTTINAQFGQEYTINAGISITKQFFDKRSKLQAKAAKLNVDRSRLEQELFEELLYEQVFLYYYTALIATKAIELGEKDLQSASQITELTREKYKQGLLDASAEISTAINENKIAQGLNANKQLQQQCTVELKKLLGLKPAQKLVLTGKVDYDLPEPLLNQSLQEDKALATTQMEVDQADLQVRMNKAALLPTLSMTTYYGRQQFRDNLGLGLSSEDWTPFSYVTLNLNVPIFSGFKNKQEIRQSRISHEISLNDQRQQQQESQLNDELLISNYNLSLRDAALSKETFDLYKKNVELSSQRFEEGLISLDAHLSTFEDYIKAENAYLNSLSTLYTHYSQIEYRL